MTEEAKKPVETSGSESLAANCYETASWELSCDNCNSQEEGGHYCLLHGCNIKNMDITRCPSWHPKD